MTMEGGATALQVSSAASTASSLHNGSSSECVTVQATSTGAVTVVSASPSIATSRLSPRPVGTAQPITATSNSNNHTVVFASPAQLKQVNIVSAAGNNDFGEEMAPVLVTGNTTRVVTASGLQRTRKTGIALQAAQSSFANTNSTAQLATVQSGGGVSIVHVQLPPQSATVAPSVIQTATTAGGHPSSVIQATATGQLQTLSKNPVILLNKGSVIHTSSSLDGGIETAHPIQLVTSTGKIIQATGSDPHTAAVIAEALGQAGDEESKKRREILARRPSYRKILNDLSSTETQGGGAIASIATAAGPTTLTLHQNSNVGNTATSGHGKDTSGADSSDDNSSSAMMDDSSDGATSAGHHTITMDNLGRVISSAPTTIQLAAVAPGDNGTTLQGLQAITAAGAGGQTILQYGQEGPYFVPVTVSAANVQAYQIRNAGSPQSTPHHVVVTNAGANISTLAEEASRKREMRLLKNREAAKECRRKKKDYIKCLENRVAVLENQNTTLIEELKALKDLYCKKAVSDV